MPSVFTAGNVSTEFFFDKNHYRLTVNDGNEKTCIVYADSYNEKYFPEEYKAAAFFTRSSADNFNPDVDNKPRSEIFFTRLGSEDNSDGIINTFYEKSFYIKE